MKKKFEIKNNDGDMTREYIQGDFKIKLRSMLNYATGVFIDDLRNENIKLVKFETKKIIPEKDDEGKKILLAGEKLDKEGRVERKSATLGSIRDFNAAMKKHDKEIIKMLTMNGDVEKLYNNQKLYELAEEVNKFVAEVVRNRPKNS